MEARTFKKPIFHMQCKENTKGIGNKNWVIKDITDTLTVLPPFTEQQRIVERIEELLSIVDKLKVYNVLWIFWF